MSQPPPYEPYPAQPYPSGSQLPPSRSHPIDMTITIIELVLLGIGSLVVGTIVLVLGSFVGATDTCRESGCNDADGLIFATSLLLPFVLTTLAVVMSIVWLARKRIAFWIPLVAFVAWVVIQLSLVGLLDS